MTLRSTSLLRSLWGPPCQFRKATVSLYGTGRVTVDYRIVQAVYALNRCLIAHNYPTIYAQTGAYVCRAITGGTGYSLHAYGTAIDVNWLHNGYGDRAPHDIPQACVNDILAIRTTNGARVWGWGGNYTSAPRDWMHFEIVASPSELLHGIRTTPTDEGDLTMDAQATAAFAAVNAKLDTLTKWALRLEARVEELERLRWKPVAIRTREIEDHFGITSEA